MSDAVQPQDASGAQPQYEFVKALGRGGMAEVLLARKIAPGGAYKEVAFKRILPEVMREPARISRFMDEIALAAALVHPNVVGVYHWGKLGEDYFIEMEFVRGVTLKDILEISEDQDEYRTLPALEVAAIGAMMADALQYAHSFTRGDVVGIVHRDISPDNVMLNLDGTAKVLDFGIAKALKGEDRVANETQTAAGKPLYHPPEQWRGRGIDARTDLYALGTTLSLALCGRQLFEPLPGETFESIVYRVFQSERPSVAELAPQGAPAELVELIEELVQVDMDARPASARDVGRRLSKIANQLAGGDAYAARDALAARVKTLYAAHAATAHALPASIPPNALSSSDQRSVDPSQSGTGPISAHAKTAHLPGGAPPPVAVAAGVAEPALAAGPALAATTSTAAPSRSYAVWALVAAVAVLGLIVVAGGGLLWSGALSADDRPDSDVAADSAAQTPVEAPPAATAAVEPTPEAPAAAAAPAPAPPDPQPDPQEDRPQQADVAPVEPDRVAEREPNAQPPRTRRRATPSTTSTPPPVPRVRALGETPTTRRRSRRQRPASSDFGL